MCMYDCIHTLIYIRPYRVPGTSIYRTKLPNNTLKKVLSTLRKCGNISKTNVSWRVDMLSFCSTANGTQTLCRLS